MNGFWWGNGGAATGAFDGCLGINYLSIHKIHRGMGFKDLASFNATVLS